MNKRILTDEQMHPIAVQIDYEDWLRIEKLLPNDLGPKVHRDLSTHAGVLTLREDPLNYQLRVRSEWD